ncbi:MAG: AAA family ATPase [Candidatus Electrothrix sp. Rat3]|nr:AAA family ATPase [Candidatus Electrothrix rattekaaiensis]
MAKKFHYTGTCIPERHFTVDISAKLDAVMELIDAGEYFTVNRPRQYGKSTFMFLLAKRLRSEKENLALKISFEALGRSAFADEAAFSTAFLSLLKKQCVLHDMEERLKSATTGSSQTFTDLDSFITEFTKGKKVVLLIDETDAATDNALFLQFLGLLRSKYLARNEGEDSTFHSVILAGIHDVKNMKHKISPESGGTNSPWNIAADFEIDLTFSSSDIETMLQEYADERKVDMDIAAVACRLHFFTSGHPFLVSKVCYLLDTVIMQPDSSWREEDVDQAVDHILREKNTNFESLIKNLENNSELYRLVENILLKDIQLEYSEDNRLISQGVTYGIFGRERTKPLHIHNRIYKERIYNYITLNLKIGQLIDKNIEQYSSQNQFVTHEHTLDFEKVLTKFQQFMKEQYSPKDTAFVERNWRLLYLAFLKPIINGHGFDFKEVQISEEKRLDVVITYNRQKYINELKIWKGAEQHKKGIAQLVDYLNRQGRDQGFLVIFDFRKKMEYRQEKITVQGKGIFMVWV